MVLIIFLLLMDVSKGAQGRSTIMERIPDYLRKLCPRSNACNVNDSTLVSVDDSVYESCCTYCSCKSNCADEGNCCFAPRVQPNDTNTKGDNFPVRKDVRVQCLYPKVNESSTDVYEFVSYNMISSLRDKESLDNKESCAFIKVAPWGSLYPVSSKQTGEIYKNSVCAKVNNITDGVLWDAILRCNMQTPELSQTMEIAHLFADLEIGVMPYYCNVHFSYPGDLKDIKSYVCYKDMVDNCTAFEFQVPEDINATKEDILEACQSGLASPYYGPNGIYANVFCFICSGSIFYSADKCTVKDTSDENELFSNADTDFMALLDPDAVLKKNKFSVNEQVPMVCPKSNNNNASYCRPLLCPTAQLRDVNSKCVFPTKRWYQKLYTVALELRSEKIIDLNEAFQWSDNGYFGYITDMSALYLSEMSRLTSWNVETMWYKITKLDSNRTTNTILLYMTRYFNTSNPAVITKNIGLLMNRKWLLRTKNETLVLKPSLFRLKHPFYQQDMLTSGRFQGKESTSVVYSFYKKFYSSDYLYENGFLVTKLYFCDQIELGIGEYVLSTDQGVMYNKFSKSFLFDGEFIIKYGNSDNSVRICFENSGFVQQNLACANARAMATLLCLYFFQFLQSLYGWDL